MLIYIAIVIGLILAPAFIISVRQRRRQIDDYAGTHDSPTRMPFGDSPRFREESRAMEPPVSQTVD